jgi:hypothetical protein
LPHTVHRLTFEVGQTISGRNVTLAVKAGEAPRCDNLQRLLARAGTICRVDLTEDLIVHVANPRPPNHRSPGREDRPQECRDRYLPTPVHRMVLPVF